MLKPKATILSRLKFDYSIPAKVRDEYAELLMSRAVRFYLENSLDSSVVEEDLIPFCKTCGEELDLYNLKHIAEEDEKRDHKAVVEYSNLEHSIKHEKEYQKKIIGYNKAK